MQSALAARLNWWQSAALVLHSGACSASGIPDAAVIPKVETRAKKRLLWQERRWSAWRSASRSILQLIAEELLSGRGT